MASFLFSFFKSNFSKIGQGIKILNLFKNWLSYQSGDFHTFDNYWFS
jgi:hypothetical protein